jgi:hypothetical protein
MNMIIIINYFFLHNNVQSSHVSMRYVLKCYIKVDDCTDRKDPNWLLPQGDHMNELVVGVHLDDGMVCIILRVT